MAVMIVAVPAALVEKQLETAIALEIIILDQLLLREAVDHHEQYELRRRLAARRAGILGEDRRATGIVRHTKSGQKALFRSIVSSQVLFVLRSFVDVGILSITASTQVTPGGKAMMLERISSANPRR